MIFMILLLPNTLLLIKMKISTAKYATLKFVVYNCQVYFLKFSRLKVSSWSLFVQFEFVLC